MSRHQLHICTIGGHQHGKTAVTRALLERWNPRERAVAHAGVLRSYYFSFETDCQKYQVCDLGAPYIPKHLVTGGWELDGAIVVVSAAEGVTPEVEKQIRLARFGGVPAIIPFLNKCDLVSHAQGIDLSRRGIVDLLQSYRYRIGEPSVVLGACLGGDGRSALFGNAVQRLSDLMDREFRSRYA